ncbi:hypothetical protein D3877_13745 [Azospirillum cavernae]|uniref:Uncharacterized protein n=1 Tax=Azospirillum cavernae TaxID=2320860 RepID=A0A418VVT9_9PROT|nr:hypothetical protein [Azospirillum cavernae]RJF81253.1 hypothetical protein D3877_13745 [Azospirillum cavernae]
MFTVVGGILLFNGAPRSGSDEAVAAAQQAQTAWAQERSRDLIAQRPWNGQSRPPDAPGAPSEPLMLVGGVGALLIAAWLGVRAARHPWS